MTSMRKTLFMIVLAGTSIFIFGCSMFSNGELVTPSPVRPVEYFVNGSFEQLDDDGFPVGNYVPVEDTSVSVDNTLARTGNNSILIKRGAERGAFTLGGGWISDLRGEETYEITVWFRAPEILEHGYETLPIYIRTQIGGASSSWERDWLHPLPSGAQYAVNVGGATNHLVYVRPLPSARQDKDDPTDWHPLSFTFTLPEGEHRVIINMFNDSSDGSLWIDDVSFKML